MDPKNNEFDSLKPLRLVIEVDSIKQHDPVDSSAKSTITSMKYITEGTTDGPSIDVNDFDIDLYMDCVAFQEKIKDRLG